ncbi:uncharacterized protein LOC111806840 isoform X2 [Cucurbita pepo subsp. pepo]|uniref:uncharacterized protein LOC111806840 isoform X2 n=1 Tax=Cucurbita pepo subsp. pepo TaxID=3664 RepID=UPI000C9D9493|nr:uncharacterized protein LOC111806840 isoform X2 [Cucurbita pepo subsp. pepo]
MAALHSYLSRFFSDFPFRITNYSEADLLMFFVFFTFSALGFSLYLRKRLRTISKANEPERIDIDQTCLVHSLLFERLPPDSPKWTSFFVEQGQDDLDLNKEFGESGQEEQGGKRKKKRAKKKRANLLHGGDEPELTLLYPFTSSTSVIQRKIKRQYDELMKCQESKELTLAQVTQFANCLINARSKLQHKADVIRRKFTITKALLYKADRSSLDRLQQQIYKLELEQKRLEEDTFVFNWLQQQLKLSPAYKKPELMIALNQPSDGPDAGNW